MAEIGPNIDRKFRLRLGGICVCWSVIAFANFGIEHARWYPDATAWFAIASAVCTAVLAAKPAAEVAYRFGGVLALGTLTLRCATIISTELRAESRDLVWLATVQFAINVLLALLYADWWLSDVKDWHRAHRLARR